MNVINTLEELKYEDQKDAPIVVIDSGLGGLEALSKLCDEFPIENFLYFCDNEMIPLGNKNPSLVNNRVNKISRFLKKVRPKAIVLACNTIDSISYDSIQSSFPNIEVYSIIIPTINKALATTKTKNIAILATKATINNQAYAKYALSKSKINMYGVECINLAESIENNENITSVLKQETSVLQGLEFDTVVLGCTHYSLIKKEVEKLFENKIIIDSTEELVNSVVQNIDSHLLNRANKQEIKIVITEDNDIIKNNIDKTIKKKHSLYQIKI